MLQSAANLQITMIAGGNHTDIQYAGPYKQDFQQNDKLEFDGITFFKAHKEF